MLDIKKYLHERGETITSLAHGISTERSYLSKVINGKDKPSNQLLKQIALYLKLTPQQTEEIIAFASSQTAKRGEKDSTSQGMGVNEDMENGQTPTVPNNSQANQLEVNIPNNIPILYSDSAFITANPYGIVLDFAQSLASTNKFNVIGRIGLSLEHARAIRDLLNQKINEIGKIQSNITQKIES